jgi:D-alanyl-D-alanine carboxypeptidase-like protein
MKRPQGLNEIIATFGDPRPYLHDDGTIAPEWERTMIVRVDLPAPIPYADTVVRRVAVHHLIAVQTKAAFDALFRSGNWHLIKEYGGGYVPRKKRRGSSEWSAHLWGIALDLNDATLPQGTKLDQPRELIDAFTLQGFYYGGLFTGKARDPQHMQWCSGY